MFPHIVSIFNGVETKTGITYTKTVLKRVLYIQQSGVTLKLFDNVTSDIVKVYIPKRVVDSENKTYIDEKRFFNCQDEKRDNFYTIARGDYIGFNNIVLEDLTPQSYRNKYGNMFEIASVEDYNMGGLPSWLVIAK